MKALRQGQSSALQHERSR